MAWKGEEVAKDSWNVCWDFENPKQSKWTGKGYWKQEQEAYPWPQNQNQWWNQASSWPGHGDEEASWAYFQQQLVHQALAAGAAYHSSGFMVRQEESQDDGPLITAMPASLEKRLSQLEAARAAPPPPDREFEGSIKSLSERNSYGFISSEDVQALYRRDTYLPKELMPEGTKVGDQVIFKIGLSKKGHPQVTEIRKAT
eukprot:TRINITY_DN92030_c0_g1_i1.p1 TRINITY_DN92030_c0_g1~~TRINITY_DN92030_c0_g1_i1.p1  ORF type:complete len:199 (+),score=44.08 TRINITY_DN92030_c0_g1_i1:64-660(+)